jgi:hypothetical protein
MGILPLDVVLNASLFVPFVFLLWVKHFPETVGTLFPILPRMLVRINGVLE